MELDQIAPGQWAARIEILTPILECEYKYVILDVEGNIELWESGENRKCRQFFNNSIGQSLYRQDEFFRHHSPFFKFLSSSDAGSAGLAVIRLAVGTLLRELSNSEVTMARFDAEVA